MRMLAIVVSAAMICGSAQGTAAAAKLAPIKAVTVPYYPGLKSPAAMRAAFAPNAAQVTQDQIADCAHVAALRMLAARTAGFDTANQSRIAELAFAMCLAQTPGG